MVGQRKRSRTNRGESSSVATRASRLDMTQLLGTPQPNLASNFRDIEAQANTDKRKSKKIVVEYRVAPDVDAYFNVHHCFALLKWSAMLLLSGVYYPNMVCEFYAHLKLEKDRDFVPTVKSWVRGHEIILTVEIVHEILGIEGECDNVLEYLEPHRVNLDINWRFEEALEFLQIPVVGEVKPEYWITRARPDARVFAFLISRNIMPKAGGYNEVRKADIFYLDMLVRGRTDFRDNGISLGHIILQEMGRIARSFNKACAFPLFLTKVFTYFGVPLPTGGMGEVAHTTSKHILTKEVLMNINLELINRVWINPHNAEAPAMEAEGAQEGAANPPTEAMQGPRSHGHRRFAAFSGASSSSSGYENMLTRLEAFGIEQAAMRLDVTALRQETAAIHMQQEAIARQLETQENLSRHLDASLVELGNQNRIFWKFMNPEASGEELSQIHSFDTDTDDGGEEEEDNGNDSGDDSGDDGGNDGGDGNMQEEAEA